MNVEEKTPTVYWSSTPFRLLASTQLLASPTLRRSTPLIVSHERAPGCPLQVSSSAFTRAMYAPQSAAEAIVT